MADIEWKGKPRLSTVKDECCGKCKSFRPEGQNPDLGTCMHFMYFPNRYPNQVCINFEKTA